MNGTNGAGIRSMMRAVSCGQSGKLVKPVAFAVAAGLVELLPVGCLTALLIAMFGAAGGAPADAAFLWGLCAAMAALFAAVALVEHASLVASFVDGFGVSARAKIGLAEHIRTLPLGFLDEAGQASLTNSMMGDIAIAEHGMTHILPQLASGVVVALLGSCTLAFVDWRMALAAFAGLPLAVVIVAAGRGLRRRGDERLAAAKVTQGKRLQDFLYGIAEVKSCEGGGVVAARAKAACEGYRDASLALERTTGALNQLAGAALMAGLPLIVAVGAALAAAGSLELPVFVLFLLVGTRMFDPLAAAIASWAELEGAQRAGERVMALMDTPSLPGEGAVPKAGDVTFEGVSFRYGATGCEVLRDVSARMEPGTCTAIVGPSGSGKSTMLRLAARFYDPCAGAVRIGGAALEGCNPERVFDCVSMVFQDVYVFHDTLENNIRYGREDATHEEVVAAARTARCHEFIEALPEGYGTLAGEGGSTLSGGERQRIAIARALLKDAPILLLDEATSALDPVNEREVQRALDALMEGRTVIMVAHQLRTVRGADEIVVLDGGRVSERGTHDELVAANGLYARLWRMQQEADGWRIV